MSGLGYAILDAESRLPEMYILLVVELGLKQTRVNQLGEPSLGVAEFRSYFIERHLGVLDHEGHYCLVGVA